VAGQLLSGVAAPLLLAGYEGLRQRQDRLPASAKGRLSEARDRLVQLYEAWGKPEQAQQWQAERTRLPKPAEQPGLK
jgi:hypothetical protein